MTKAVNWLVIATGSCLSLGKQVEISEHLFIKIPHLKILTMSDYATLMSHLNMTAVRYFLKSRVKY